MVGNSPEMLQEALTQAQEKIKQLEEEKSILIRALDIAGYGIRADRFAEQMSQIEIARANLERAHRWQKKQE